MSRCLLTLVGFLAVGPLLFAADDEYRTVENRDRGEAAAGIRRDPDRRSPRS